MLNFRLDWPPTINTYWRYKLSKHGSPLIYVTEKGQKYKRDGYIRLAEQNVPKGMAGRVEVIIDAYPPDRRKRDIDNITKVILDVLQDYGVFDDDEQVDILTIRRRSKAGYVQIMVHEIPPDDSLCN